MVFSKIFELSSIFIINDSIDFQVNGGKKLHGKIKTNFSKNGSVGLLCASLLNKGTTTLHGIARIEEVYRVIEILQSISVKVKWIDQNSVQIVPPKKFNLVKINVRSAVKTRSVIMLIGPMIHFLKSFSLPHAEGCNLGKRTINAHTYALEKLGIKIKTTNNSHNVSLVKTKPADIVMYESGDTASENVLTASALIKGKTTISFASANYMVQEICFFLEALGVKIDGIGTSTLVVHGVKEINKDIEYWNSEDPIESMMFISACVVTDSRLTITRCPIDFLELELLKLEKMGLNVFFFPAEMIGGCDFLSDSGTTTMTNEQWAALHLGDEAYGSNRGYFLLMNQIRETFGEGYFNAPEKGKPNADKRNALDENQQRTSTDTKKLVFSNECEKN